VIGFSSKDEAVLAGVEYLLEKRKNRTFSLPKDSLANRGGTTNKRCFLTVWNPYLDRGEFDSFACFP
jgi:hypothetical protein